MSTLSTHVLDTASGKPAAGIGVTLVRGDQVLAHTTTDGDGRVRDFVKALDAGEYRLRFDVEAYFARQGRESFYRTIAIDFLVRTGGEHHHVPLLLSPFGYSTYRGS